VAYSGCSGLVSLLFPGEFWATLMPCFSIASAAYTSSMTAGGTLNCAFALDRKLFIQYINDSISPSNQPNWRVSVVNSRRFRPLLGSTGSYVSPLVCHIIYNH
jgi:hypothetical protein